jgi:DNA-binding transcriptional LysR family regulator
MIEAVKAGIGIAQLPCLLGDAEPKLKRISSIDKNHIFDVWMLIHNNLRHIARFRAFLDFFAKESLNKRF